jgi:uncharacterized LabA/DUF88 family protein
VEVFGGIPVKRVGIFVDINDMYQSVRQEHGGKLDYRAYYEFISVLGEIKVALAYGSAFGDESEKFVGALHSIGFKARYRRALKFLVDRPDSDEPKVFRVYPNWDCGLTVDVIKALPDLDMVVLGVSSDNLVPLVKYIQEQGKDAVICANSVSKKLAKAATEVIGVTASLLVG